MLGAIIGDIIGSRFEFNNHRSKDFTLFSEGCSVTDDSLMTLAVAQALMEASKEEPQRVQAHDADFLARLSELSVEYMRKMGRQHPECGFGNRFYKWIFADKPQPYDSFGNGAAMRVSPVGFFAESEDEAECLAKAVTAVTHNHAEGIKGATATALAVFLAKKGASKQEIRARITGDYYPLDFQIDEIRPTYRFDVSCQGSVPQAIECFLESTSFEDAIRTAVSLGGDSDTIAAITGAIAEACYGIPDEIREKALGYLGGEQRAIYEAWQSFVPADADRPYVSTVILLPYFEKLREDVKKLRTALTRLIEERDELRYVECRNIEMLYMLKIGKLEYEAYKLQCKALHLQREIELIQAIKNRQEVVILSRITEQIDLEFARYQEKMREMGAEIKAAAERRFKTVLSEEEVREFKTLYRGIVKRLHPDLNLDLNQEQIRLFIRAVEAYKDGDLDSLRLIGAMLDGLAPEDTEPDVMTRLLKEKERLLKLIQFTKDDIKKIKSEYPYRVKPVVESPEKMAVRRDEINEYIAQVKKVIAIHEARIEEMLEQ